MPGQEEWEQGQWEIVAALFERVARALGEADCTVIADRGLSCLTLIQLCQAHGWHYVLRIKQDEYAQRKRYGMVRLWKEHAFETQLRAVWDEGHEEAWFLISDRPAGRKRIQQYGWRMRVESTFQDMKRRGWQWESSHVRQRDRLERPLSPTLFRTGGQSAIADDSDARVSIGAGRHRSHRAQYRVSTGDPGAACPYRVDHADHNASAVPSAHRKLPDASTTRKPEITPITGAPSSLPDTFMLEGGERETYPFGTRR
jgi:Transposase DDE domain